MQFWTFCGENYWTSWYSSFSSTKYDGKEYLKAQIMELKYAWDPNGIEQQDIFLCFILKWYEDEKMANFHDLFNAAVFDIKLVLNSLFLKEPLRFQILLLVWSWIQKGDNRKSEISLLIWRWQWSLMCGWPFYLTILKSHLIKLNVSLKPFANYINNIRICRTASPLCYTKFFITKWWSCSTNTNI